MHEKLVILSKPLLYRVACYTVKADWYSSSGSCILTQKPQRCAAETFFKRQPAVKSVLSHRVPAVASQGSAVVFELMPCSPWLANGWAWQESSEFPVVPFGGWDFLGETLSSETLATQSPLLPPFTDTRPASKLQSELYTFTSLWFTLEYLPFPSYDGIMRKTDQMQ